MATGFDAITGGIKNIDITGLNGLTINEKWSSGTHAYLGSTVSVFPNFFYTYGALSSSAYASGPSTVESQSDWIVQAMRKMQTEGLTRINATEEAESEWKSLVNTIHAMTLRENVEGSWYLGLNIPGKAREPLCFGGGLPLYRSEIKKAIVPDWKGFTVS